MKDAIWLNEYFRIALEASPSGQLIVDHKGIIRHINNKISDIFGYTSDELKEKCIEMLVPLDSRQAHPSYRDNFFSKPVVRNMGSGQILFGLHKTGAKIPIEIGLNPLSDRGEGFVLASIVDISERVKSERRFQLALEASPSGLILINDTGSIVLVNSKVEEIFGYYRDDLINENIGKLVPERYRAQHPTFMTDFLAMPRSRGMGIGRELFGLRKNGSEVPVEIGLNPLEIEGRVHVLASIVDITERKQVEKEKHELNNQIQHAQRMESLGILAGGTAHDFNNILSVISGNAELIHMSLPVSAPNREKLLSFLDNIVRSCKRAAGLTNQMLAYAGKGNITVENTYINDIVNDMLGLLISSLPKKISITANLDSSLPPIGADRSQIQQVIMNLVTNAAEAINTRTGTINIVTGIESINKQTLKEYKIFDTMEEGSYQYLVVEDTGCGMTKEVSDNMFDPFFTTKFTGRGLGMASVLGIIRSHNGSIRVESKVDVGTQIKIIFPNNTGSDLGSNDSLNKGKAVRRVLIVDDEKDICDMLANMFSLNDFAVTTAPTGEKGLAIVNFAKEAFDLIILDMNMPGISGFEFYDELVKANYNTKIIMISGYSEKQVHSIIERDKANGRNMIIEFIKKPFEFATLQALVETHFPK